MQMQEAGKNMYDVRKELGIKSVRAKVEKRVLERVGHVMRLEDGCMVKSVTLGWLEDLEQYPEKAKGKKRKTLLYWKKMIREAGLDYTKIGEYTEDRDAWKSVVRERFDHILKFEETLGNKFEGEMLDRNVGFVQPEELICNHCQKECKSKSGLVVHIKRLHNISKMKKVFTCTECEMVFQQEGNLLNHKKACGGKKASTRSLRACDNCHREYAATNFARHRKSCIGVEQQARQVGEVQARVHVSQRAPCDQCGLSISKANMARHKRTCQGRREVH